MQEQTKQEIYNLRVNKHLTYREIAEKVGVSYQTVGIVLNRDYGLFGDREYPELENESTFINNPDSLTAIFLGASEAKVTKARIKLGISRYYIVDVLDRRTKLAQDLFDLYPGRNFSRWIINLCLKEFTLKQAALIVDFYITGKIISLAKNNKDSDRVYRSWTRQKLREIVKEVDVTGLLKKEVLCSESII